MSRRSCSWYGILYDAKDDVHQVVLTLFQLLYHLVASVQIIGVAAEQLVHMDHVSSNFLITEVEQRQWSLICELNHTKYINNLM